MVEKKKKTLVEACTNKESKNKGMRKEGEKGEEKIKTDEKERKALNRKWAGRYKMCN